MILHAETRFTRDRRYVHDGIVLDEDPGVSLAACQAAMDNLRAFDPSADILACAVAMRPEGRR